MKTLITGGSGMVGAALKPLLPHAICPGSKDLNLLKFEQTLRWFRNDNYNIVYHLAAKVGGLKANSTSNASFFQENTTIHTNLLEVCRLEVVPKVVSMLSTCVYPDELYVTYPLTEDQLHMGPPHSSNFGYAFSKRMLDVHSRAIRQQHGHNFVTVIPNNLFGPNDNFDLETSHVIPALMRKIHEAKLNNAPSVEVWGDGSPLREFTYSKDIAKVLVWVGENYNEPDPLNIGNTVEVSIKHVVEQLCKIFEYKGTVVYNSSKPNGQHRKPSSNKKLRDLGCDVQYTEFEVALKETYDWFVQSYPNVRGMKQ